VDLKKRTRNLIQLVQKSGERQNIISLNRQLVEQLFPGTIRELQKTIDKTRSRGTLFQDVGSLLGMFAFTFAAAYFNRRTAFLGSFVLCLCSVSYVFYSLKTATDVLWMLPLMGFATLSCFAGYSIYFPEIFPTRLRGTGVGFCYNTVRYLAAPFPFLLGWLSTLMPFRTVGRHHVLDLPRRHPRADLGAGNQGTAPAGRLIGGARQSFQHVFEPKRRY
jgi:hypothetical protein